MQPQDETEDERTDDDAEDEDDRLGAGGNLEDDDGCVLRQRFLEPNCSARPPLETRRNCDCTVSRGMPRVSEIAMPGFWVNRMYCGRG